VKKERWKLRLARVAGGRRRDGGTHTGFFYVARAGGGSPRKLIPRGVFS
jgi:hypothetical protein